MYPYKIELGRIVLPEYCRPVLEYWNPNFRHLAEFSGNLPGISRKDTFKVVNDDCSESAEMQYIGRYHMDTMSMIPLRLLALQGVHTTFSIGEVKNCICGFDENTANGLREEGKYSTVEGAAKFKRIPGWEPVGTLVIPYSHTLKGGITPSDAFEKYGLPNVTLRTNSTKMKYTRMATNTYNFFNAKKVMTRMPFVPIVSVSDEMQAINLRCIVCENLHRLGLENSSEAFGYANDIANILASEKTSENPLLIIEGEKKALALQAAMDSQLESVLYGMLKTYRDTGSKDYEKAENAAEKMFKASVIGISGVWQTEKRSCTLHRDLLECIDFGGRDVFVCYDRDISENGMVACALGVMNLGLVKAGAKSVSAASPQMPEYMSHIPPEKCKGFDDMSEAIFMRTYGANAYERYLKSMRFSLKTLRDSFFVMRKDYSYTEFSAIMSNLRQLNGADILKMIIRDASMIIER